MLCAKRNAYTLEALQYDDKTVLVVIRVVPRLLHYFHGQGRPHRTHRWMHAEDWARFDMQLQQLLLKSKDYQVVTMEERWELNPLVQVRVCKSRVPLEALCKCVNSSVENGDEQLNVLDVVVALECVIEYCDDGKWGEKETKHNIKVCEFSKYVKDDSVEYEPTASAAYCKDSHSPHSYVPYTPLTEQKSRRPADSISSPEANVQHDDLDRYSPQPLTDRSDFVQEMPPVPTYNPSRIRTRKCAKSMTKVQVVDKTEETTESVERERNSRVEEEVMPKQKSKRYKAENKVNKSKEQTEGKDDMKIKSKKTPKNKHHEWDNEVKLDQEVVLVEGSQPHEALSNEELTKALENHIKSLHPKNSEKMPPKFGEMEEIGFSGDTEDSSLSKDHTEPRRSTRSPNKPMRFQEHSKVTMIKSKKRTKSKSPTLKKRNKNHDDLFGSDDDFEGENHVHVEEQTLKTPSAKLADKSSGAAHEKKRRHDKATECDKEKHAMNVWLGKKVPIKSPMSSNTSSSSASHNQPQAGSGGSSVSDTSDKRKTKLKREEKVELRNSTSSAPASDGAATSKAFLYKEETEERMRKEKIQIESNRKLKKVLEEMAGPTPERVDTLSLERMKLNEILDSFVKHKTMLDELFDKLRKKPEVRGYNGVDHYLVIHLLDNNKQLKMMEKLCEVYDANSEGSSPYASLFCNAMMPAWVIGIFMDKYNFTRDEAIAQVKAQEAYNLHLRTEDKEDFLLI